MSAQLFQLLAQLDREGATELVISIGRPIALRVNGAYQTVTPATVSQQQLDWLLRGTPLVAMVAEGVGVGEPQELEIGGRYVRAQVIRSGGDLMVRFEAAKRSAGRPAPAPRAQTQPGGNDERGVARSPVREPGAAPRPTGSGTVSEREPAPAAPRAAPQAAGSPSPAREPAPSRDPAPMPFGSSVHFRTPANARATSEAAEIRELELAEPEPNEPETDRGEGGMITRGLAALIKTARERNATDLHVAANRPVMIRTVGELVALEREPRTAAAVAALLVPLLDAAGRASLEERGYVDLAIQLPRGGRMRGNVSRQQGGLKGAFRIAKVHPPTLDELGLPQELAKVTAHHQGLVVIAGPSGHGKTTTLAALVNLVNSSEPIHILTIEDPVEIEHPRKVAVISQREVGRHTVSFAAALKASLREDPDVIVIGELRDRETVEIALTAAETGHLVIATMSTPSAAKTIDRLIDMFPPDEQNQVRASLAGALRAIIAQRLLPSAAGDSLVAAVELVAGSLPLATLIRENKLYQLPNLMQRGRSLGMMRLDESLFEHVRAGRISEEVALAAADSKKELLAVLHPQEAAAAPAKSRFGGLFGKKDRE